MGQVIRNRDRHSVQVRRGVLLTAALIVAISLGSGNAVAKDRSSERGDDGFQQLEEARHRAEEQQREQEKQAREAQQRADQQRQEQERQAREAQKAADQQRQEQEKQARQAQQAAERQRHDQEQQARPAPQQPQQSEHQQSAPVVQTGNGAQNGADRDSAAPAQSATSRPQETRNESAGDRQNSSNRQQGSDNRDANGKSARNEQNSSDKPQPAAEKKDEPPPATVKEWLERVTSPAQPSTPASNQSKDAQQAPAPAVPAAPATAKSSTKTSAAVTPLPPIVFPDFKPNEVLAINASAKTLADAKSLGFTVKTVTSLSSLNLSVAKLQPPAGLDAASAEKLLNQKLPSAEVALNKEYKIYRTATGTAPPSLENRPQTPSKITEAACAEDHCYGREIIGWHAELDQCSKGIKIGVIDTSIDIGHPVFANRKIEISHLAENGLRGPNWHGTGIMGLLAGDAPGGVLGLAPQADYSVADAFYAGTDDLPASDTLSMLRAFDWLEKRHVNIVNMSLSGPPDDLLHKAIDRLAGQGVIFVAAAGNEGPNAAPSYPAAYKNVVAVTAVNKELAGYRYANRGDYVDFAAPGVAVWTAMPGGTGAYHSGTSFAAPFATAAIAAVYNQLPGKTADDVVRMLKVRDLGAPGKDPIYGNGLIMAPATCGGGGVASASTTSTVSRHAADVNQKAAPAAQDEVLPWLGFAPQ